jgi:hypothetical protein
VTPPSSPATVRTTPRLLWALLRLAMAALIVAAIVAQLIRTLGFAIDKDRDFLTVLTNFFSFFTILSNVLAAITLLVCGLWLLSRGRRREFQPRALSVLLLSVGTYMVITGVVYNTMLRGIALEPGGTVAWSNEVLHVAGPAMMLLELILRVGVRPISWRSLWVVVGFPIVWVIYTMIRGEQITNPVTGQPWWYPYPFLNPYTVPNGYIGVAGYVVGISVAVIAVASLAIWWSRRKTGVEATAEPAESPAAIAAPAS